MKKEYKYTINGNEYEVAIGEIVENEAVVTVNGEEYKVAWEPEAEPEKKVVVRPVAQASESSEASEGGPQAANVSVTVDAIMIPGTMASGDVVFSDGVKGKWYLDQMGRLGLGGDLPQGYRPAPEDAALFQARLMEALRSKGLC